MNVYNCHTGKCTHNLFENYLCKLHSKRHSVSKYSLYMDVVIINEFHDWNVRLLGAVVVACGAIKFHVQIGE